MGTPSPSQPPDSLAVVFLATLVLLAAPSSKALAGREASLPSPFAAEFRDHLAAAEALVRTKDLVRADSAVVALHHAAAAAFGARSGQVAEVYILEGVVALVRWDLDRARMQLETALRIADGVEGGDAIALQAAHRLAWVYTATDRDAQAIRILESRIRAVPIERRKDPALAPPLYTLAVAKLGRSDLVSADSLFRAALELTPDSDGRGRASALNGLGMVCREQARYAEAQDHFEQAIATARSSGADTATLASSLNNLGTLLLDIGDYDEAVETYTDALELQRKAHGEDHPNTAGTLVNLADALRHKGSLAEARRFHEQALAIREKVTDPDTDDIAISLRKLAEVLLDLGDSRRALPLASRAEAIRRERLGPEDFDTAKAMVTHARALRAESNTPGAEIKLREAVRVFERSLGRDHPDWCEATLELADLRAAMGAMDEAWRLATEAEQHSRDHARLMATALSERHALRYSATRDAALDLMLALVGKRPAADVTVAWDHVIRSRAIVLDEMMARRTSDPATEAVYARTSRDLANLLVRGSRSGTMETLRRQIAVARHERDRAERALGASSRARRSVRKSSEVGMDLVVRSLPANAALVSYVVATRAHRRHYYAFVLRSGERRPTFHDLGDAPRVDGAVDRWRAAVADPGDLTTYRATALELRRAAWDPIASRVSGRDLVLIVADGALHRVNFATLPDDGDGFLIESGPTFCFLSAERDLAGATTSHPRGKGMLSIGGVDFGVATPATFAPLPATLEEAEAVARIWRDATGSEASVMSGSRATEAAFKKDSAGCRIVHLATHGFVGGHFVRTANGTRSIGGLSQERPLGPSWLQSGLALANANGLPATSTSEDGILTPEEIATLDLSGAEWVVLSACDTGVGTVQEGEGVLGLRRSFEVSGAGTLIMSLWDVDDSATREWMELLYRSHFETRNKTAQAIRAASRGVLAWAQVRHKTSHPFFWGAFVGVGDWR